MQFPAFDACSPVEEAYFDQRPDRPPEPSGPVFSAEEQLALDEFAAKVRARRKPPEWVAYEQAVQDHERETERLKAECGVTAAHELEDATSEAVNQVRDALAETPAKTLAGLIYKARYAAAHYRTEYDADVMVSIVDDLMAMAEDGTHA